MATNILQLPKVSIPCAIENNEDWRDALAFTDINNNPVDLTGIRFTLAVRQSDADAWVMFSASNDDYVSALLAGATVMPVSAGTGYAIGEALTLPGGLVVQVALIGAGGSILAVSIKTPGSFNVVPTNPAQQLATTGQGNGALFLLTFVPNALTILVPAVVVGTALPSGTYSYEITAQADGYTADVVEGVLTVSTGASA